MAHEHIVADNASLTRKQAIAKIQDAKLKRTRSLDLSSTHQRKEYLETLPPEIYELTHLEVLRLNGIGLREIPKELECLVNLKRLYLGGNNITTIPKSLYNLRNLVELDLSYNNILGLQVEISELKALRKLYLGGNHLKELPMEVGKLSRLKYLTCGVNLFTEVPEAIYLLKELQILSIGCRVSERMQLWRSHVDYWQIDQLLDDIKQLVGLVELDLSGNSLNSLPESLSQLTQLKKIYLENNEFSYIPKVLFSLPKVEIISLENIPEMTTRRNSITEIPGSVVDCAYLSEIRLGDNPLQTPPLEVVAKGMISIKEYFKQIVFTGYDYLNEAKLLIIGEGGAGKTTLVNKILDSKYQLKEEDSTRGIEIVRWTFRADSNRDFKVNIWDFGGQEIYHATHQFFLTKRSLYILVVDTRKEDTDFYYWLNIVELLSDGSPIIIVKNEKQERIREINEYQLHQRFENLVKTAVVNLATNRGLESIVNDIKEHMLGLPIVGSQLPKTWIEVRRALEQNPNNYIKYDDYLELCKTHGFGDEADKRQLSEYLHDLGVCLHFMDEPLLKSYLILKPKWSTDAVYKALDSESLIKNKGCFTKVELHKIWSDDIYQGMHDQLLQMMIKFKLAYEIPGCTGEYIAPQLLCSNQTPYDWDINDNLHLHYTFEFVPKGILTQFIVAMHHSIYKSDCVWRNGVVLENNGVKVEVIEYFYERVIRIRAVGPQARDFLAVVQYELEKVLSGYRKLQYSKMIPCNCAKCKQDAPNGRYYKMRELQKFVLDRQLEIQCRNSYEMITVYSLIDDIIVHANAGMKKNTNNREAQIVVNILDGNIMIHNGDVESVTMENSDKSNRGERTAWVNGSFYVLAFVVLLLSIGIMANILSPISAVLIACFAIVAFTVVVAFQLRQDEKLSEKSFLELVGLAFRKLPVIKSIFVDKK